MLKNCKNILESSRLLLSQIIKVSKLQRHFIFQIMFIFSTKRIEKTVYLDHSSKYELLTSLLTINNYRVKTTAHLITMLVEKIFCS